MAHPPRNSSSFLYVPFAYLLPICALLAVSCFSVRFAYADWLARRNELDSLNRAIELAPDDASYHLRRARLTSPPSVHDLRRAAALNPTSSEPWIALGLQAEQSGDFAAAQEYFVEATFRDATYLPRWTLANFYFRRMEWDRFWQWSAAAASIYEDDLTALYRLCLRTGEDPMNIFRRVVPPRPNAQRQFVELMLAENQIPAAVAAGELLSAHGRAGDSALLVHLCSRLLAVNQSGPAVGLWNRLSGAGLIPFRQLDPASGASLTNARWDVAMTGGGFDWSAPPTEGVTLARLNRSGGIALRFSGREPETCSLLQQKLALIAGRRYRLEYRYRRQGRPAESSCRWKIDGQISQPLASTETGAGTFEFTAPDRETPALLELTLARETGQTRAEGTLEIEWADLGFATR